MRIGDKSMHMLVTLLTMLAFAATYALIATMLGEQRAALTAALLGDRTAQPAALAASRAFSRA